MKILVVHEVSYRKKVVYEYQDFAERLAAMGHQVSVVDYDDGGDHLYKRESCSKTGAALVTVENTPYLDLPILKYLTGRWNYARLLEEKLRKSEVDVVFLYSVFVNGTNTVRLCRQYGVPVVYRVLDVYHKLRMNPLIMLPLYLGEKFIYRNADVVCVTNKRMIPYVERMAGRPLNERVSVLNHGVDLDHFRGKGADAGFGIHYHILPGDKVALFLGTTYSFSGLEVIVRRFRKLKDLCPKIKVVIVGAGDLDRVLKREVAANGLEKDFILTGVRPYGEIPRFISRADIAFLSFRINDITRDIVPIKILQYLACGTPVISAPLPDVVDLFPERESGILYCDIKREDDFVELLGKTLSDETLLADLSRRAGNHIRRFDIREQMKKLEDLLVRAVRSRGKARDHAP